MYINVYYFTKKKKSLQIQLKQKCDMIFDYMSIDR